MAKKLTKATAAHLANSSVSSASNSTLASAGDHTADPSSSTTNIHNPGGSISSSSVSSGGANANGTVLNPGGLPRVLTDDEPLPRLVVFDLDYTLWPFWVDTHPVPPLKSTGGPLHAAATDKVGDTFAFYADVPRILYTLPMAGVRLAVASRTHAPDLAREMLKILHVPPGGGGNAENSGNNKGSKEKSRRALDFFDAGFEAYPASKVRHFEAIQKRTGVPYSEMLFFDDEARNRDVEQALGVLFCHVKDGMTWEELDRGVRRWRGRRQNGPGVKS